MKDKIHTHASFKLRILKHVTGLCIAISFRNVQLALCNIKDIILECQTIQMDRTFIKWRLHRAIGSGSRAEEGEARHHMW